MPLVLSRPPANPGLGVCGSAPRGWGVLRPTFLSADVQGRWGASKTIKYSGIAERLTVGGYPTKVDELKNARRTAPVAGAVPANRCACNRE